jgi:circadian clock protein KaiB
MKNKRRVDRARDFEKAIKTGTNSRDRYILRLCVTGNTPRSSRAIANLHVLCEEYLHGRYELEVVDIQQQPGLAKGEQIIAAPTLIKKLPAPLRKIVGDLSDGKRVLLGLDIQPIPHPVK